MKYFNCLVVLFVIAFCQVRCFRGVEKKNFDIKVHSFMYIEEKNRLSGTFEHFYLKKASSCLNKCENFR